MLDFIEVHNVFKVFNSTKCLASPVIVDTFYPFVVKLRLVLLLTLWFVMVRFKVSFLS